MNGMLDDLVVGLVLIISAGYVMYSLGPRSLRSRTFAALSRMTARAPGFLGLSRMARWLAASSANKSQGACGGCDNCGSDQATTSTGVAPTTVTSEVRVPLAKIGRRVDGTSHYK